MTYAATTKQKAFYKSLTGKALPYGVSKSKASSMIDAAMKGKPPFKAKPPIVEVQGFKFYNPGHASHQVRKFAISVDYRLGMKLYETFDEALTVAKAQYPDVNIIESPNTTYEQYCD